MKNLLFILLTTLFFTACHTENTSTETTSPPTKRAEPESRFRCQSLKVIVEGRDVRPKDEKYLSVDMHWNGTLGDYLYAISEDMVPAGIREGDPCVLRVCIDKKLGEQVYIAKPGEPATTADSAYAMIHDFPGILFCYTHY